MFRSDVLLWQEIARLMMEQEKREYKKIRERDHEKEREKEREREREREKLAMERMAMERKRQEGDYRVIIHYHSWSKIRALERNISAAYDFIFYVSVFPLWYKSHKERRNNCRNFGFLFQPHSEDVVRPRTRDESEHQRQRNHNKPARYQTRRDSFFRPTNCSQKPKKCPNISGLFSVSVPDLLSLVQTTMRM